jgi:hypothetical protein
MPERQDELNEAKLFVPESGRDLRKTYPELMKYDEFKELSQQDMLFVWKFALGYKDLSMNDRRERSFREAYREPNSAKDKAIYNQKLKDMIEGAGPEEIRVAIKKMGEFNISYRMRSKMMLDKAFIKLEELMDVKDSDLKDKDGISDIQKRLQYSTLLINITKALPDLIEKAEEGYGIKEIAKGERIKGSKDLLERFHQEDEEKNNNKK